MDVSHILFTHFPSQQGDRPWKQMEDHADQLTDILKDPRAPGILEIFFDSGWLSLLNSIGVDFDPILMTQEFEQIEAKEQRLANLLSGKTELQKRLRLITAKSLFPILNNLRGDKPGQVAAQIRRFLAGQHPGIRYDTAKVVEAIIRVRHIGSGIPVLRLDWDALLSDLTLGKDKGAGFLPATIRDILAHCQDLSRKHLVHSYLFSGCYLRPNGDRGKWSIQDYNTAYATRIFPALIPTKKVCKYLDSTRVSVNRNGATWTEDGDLSVKELETLQEEGLFDRKVMGTYYGSGQGGDGLARIGSDPERAVISGAGLVLSDGAIHDLPPFSNFQVMVMWIDDHLKYELHRALGHLPDVAKYNAQYKPDYAQQINAPVYKDRVLAGQSNLRAYTLGSYIPTLLWGILMDAWIRGEPPNPQSPSPFVATLERSLKRGTLEPQDRAKLSEDLKRLTLKRLRIVIDMWSMLKTEGGEPSFAALWVSGDQKAIKQIMGNKLTHPGQDWLGWGLLNGSSPTPLGDFSALRDPIRLVIDRMIDDMCTYIEWTLEWPRFIQSVRAIRNGTLELDVQYP